MPIDEKEEFNEESQISLWETEKKNSNLISNSMQKAVFQDKPENLFLENTNKKAKNQENGKVFSPKEKEFVKNPILCNDSEILKGGATNKVLEEEHLGHLPKFHQEKEEARPSRKAFGGTESKEKGRNNYR